MKWDECLQYKIKKVKENPEQACALFHLSQIRRESLEKRKHDEYPPFLVESYYETIKELLSALLALHGYKSYSHECLLSFMEKFYPKTLDDAQIHFLNTLRVLRSDIQYRGREIADDYLERNMYILDEIVTLLCATVERKLQKYL